MKITKRIFTALTAVLTSFAICGCTKNKEPDSVPADATEPIPYESAVPVSTEKQPVHFLAVGDNLIHSSIYEQAHRRGGGVNYDFTYAYSNVADLVAAADVAMINQETLICNDTIEPSDYPYFNSPTQLGDHMMYIGFDVFTIANNHILDYGQTGLENCLNYWDSRPNAVVVGVYRNQTDKDNIRTITCNNVVFSIFAYTENTNNNSLPEGSSLIIGDAYDFDGMVEDVRKAKKISDVCIVALHWGVENSDKVSDTQTDLSQRLADAGADVIVGSHPHVLRRIDMIERKDGGQTLCAYSLGNFISGQSTKQNLIGGILEFDVVPGGRGCVVTNVKLTPVISHYGENYSNNRVYLYSQYNEELAAAHGANEWTDFSMDYINSVLENTIDGKYLKLT